MKTDTLQFNRLNLVIFYLITLLVMFALKKYYSSASADQLRWILKPVAWLVSAFETLPYRWLPDVGYVRADRAITIAPACAGVNFLIMTFGLPIIAFLHHLKTFSGRITIFMGAILSAYALAIVVNAVRIMMAIALYDAHISLGWITPDRLHRMAGIAVYFSALGLYYIIWHRIIGNNTTRVEATIQRWFPWIWYITGAVAVPVIHQLYKGDALPGMEYCLTVIGLSATIWGAAKMSWYLGPRMVKRNLRQSEEYQTQKFRAP